jgi:Gpi18-like mannosyltransferase
MHVKTSDEPVNHQIETGSTSLTPDNSTERTSSPSKTRSSSLLSLCSEVVAPFLAIRLLLVLVGIVTIYYIMPLLKHYPPAAFGTRMLRFPDLLYLMWNHYDSGFYVDIAANGYWGANTLHQMSNWAFFPLYPLLMRFFALPFGASNDALRIAGIFVSNCAALIAAIYLYKLTMKELGRKPAARAVLYLALFPMSFFLSAVYTESLFLATVISCTYYARLHRWWLAGLLGGLAALTRFQGALMLIVVGWEYLQFMTASSQPIEYQTQMSGRVALMRQWLRSRLINFFQALLRWRTWLDFAWLALIPVGLALFSIYAKLKVGAFTAFSMSEKYGWHREFTNPIPVLINYIQHTQPVGPYNWDFYALNLIVIFAFFPLLIPIFRKLPSVYGIFTLVFLVMPLTSGRLTSVPRYYLVVFPVYMILAWWSRRGSQEQQEWRHTFIIIPFAILLSLGMAMFTLDVYSLA